MLPLGSRLKTTSPAYRPGRLNLIVGFYIAKHGKQNKKKPDIKHTFFLKK